MDKVMQQKEIILDGEGQVRFTIGKTFSVEIFNQNISCETLDKEEMVKLRNFLIRDMIGE